MNRRKPRRPRPRAWKTLSPWCRNSRSVATGYELAQASKPEAWTGRKRCPKSEGRLGRGPSSAPACVRDSFLLCRTGFTCSVECIDRPQSGPDVDPSRLVLILHDAPGRAILDLDLPGERSALQIVGEHVAVIGPRDRQ